MNRFILLPPERQRAIYEEAQARRGLPAQSIEKDFWVCWTLRELFAEAAWGCHLTFKGGTSLAKAWKLIERFSEDIDLVIDREHLGFAGPTLSNNQQTKLKAECSRRIHAELKPALESRFRGLIPADRSWTLTGASAAEDVDQQTLLFHYPTVFPTLSAYLRPVVKMEMGARSQTEPSAPAPIQSYVAEVFPDLVRDHTFSIRTVAARRTFLEKALLLHEETYRPTPAGGAPLRKLGLARHYYDLHRLIENGVAEEAVADQGLLEQVVEHRRIFFRYSWMDYATMQRGSIRLVPLPEQIDAWRQDYAAMRAEMFFGAAPEFDVILQTVEEFCRQMNASAAAAHTQVNKGRPT